MPIFTVERTRTRVSRERRGGELRETQVLDVEGPAEGGGRNRARFFFGPGVRPVPVVGYVVRAGTAGVSLVGWLPIAAWKGFREAIADGGPLEVHYETRDHTQGGYLRRLGLGRRNAPLVAAVPRRARSGAALQRPAFAMPL
jgi:hypothetical protein